MNPRKARALNAPIQRPVETTSGQQTGGSPSALDVLLNVAPVEDVVEPVETPDLGPAAADSPEEPLHSDPAPVVEQAADRRPPTPVVAAPDPTPVPTATSTTPVPLGVDPIMAAIQQADRDLESQGLTLPGDVKEVTSQYVMYPVKGTREAFMQLRDQLGLTNAALVRKAVNDHLQELMQLMGPTAENLVPGYKPKACSPRDKVGIVLRLTTSDDDLYKQLVKRWPGCRSVNDLLSTAVDMLVR